MSAPAKVARKRVPGTFEPVEAKDRIADAKLLAERFARLHEWQKLTEAVEFIIEEQEGCIGWWRENVTIHHGAGRGKKSADLGTFSMADAEEQTGIRNQQISRWAQRLKNKPAYQDALEQAARRKAMAEKGQTDQRGASGTGENEWYTPEEYLNLARDVLGGIDLDPASSDAAQERVRAAHYFTKADDGLAKEWGGRVWLNPPYAQPHIADFVSKMVNERTAGRVAAAIMLTHNYTDTAWFHQAASVADAICFMRGRVKFTDANGVTAAPTQGQAFFYFGEDVGIFGGKFSAIGFVVRPYWGEVPF